MNYNYRRQTLRGRGGRSDQRGRQGWRRCSQLRGICQDVNIMIGMIIVIRVVLGVHCPESDIKLTWTWGITNTYLGKLISPTNWWKRRAHLWFLVLEPCILPVQPLLDELVELYVMPKPPAEYFYSSRARFRVRVLIFNDTMLLKKSPGPVEPKR